MSPEKESREDLCVTEADAVEMADYGGEVTDWLLGQLEEAKKQGIQVDDLIANTRKVKRRLTAARKKYRI